MQVELPQDLLTQKVWALGLPLAPLPAAQVIEAVDSLIQARDPSYFITANLNYAMLTKRYEDLREMNRNAAFIVADGMPLVWDAWRQGTPVPERVAGSDLIFDLARLAADRGYRLFLLGAGPGVAEEAARNLIARYPGLQVVGIESPDMASLSDVDNARLVERVRAAQADLLIVALSQPKGDRWIHENYRGLEIPVSVNLGASLDFAAGRVRRAPRWIQKAGLEWVFRLALEPRRLTRRYLENGLFFLGEELRAFARSRPSATMVGQAIVLSRRGDDSDRMQGR